MSRGLPIPDYVAMALERGDSSVQVFRLAAGLSTTRFAGLAGMTVERVEEIEAGAAATDAELQHMCRVLGIPNELMSGSLVRLHQR